VKNDLGFDAEELVHLRQLFRDEVHTALDVVSTRALAVGEGVISSEALAEMMRVTHTLKGSAGTVGLGGMVALVVDMGVTGGDGVAVEFLGHETVFPAGPARLARISGAPIIFGWAARKPRGRYLAHVSAPILSDRGLSPEEDARQVTRRIVAEFEQAVRRYPEQWYVFREMWPEGERSLTRR
jgi:lauroyl/myristoyl acyltransferase